MNKMHTYEFRGVLHPNQIKFNLGPISSPFKSENGLTGHVSFSINDGNIGATLESALDLKDFDLFYMGCIGEMVLLGIYPYLDVVGYVNGLALSVELIEAKDPDSDIWKRLPTGVPVIEKRTANKNERYEEICSLFDSPKGWYIQKALSDLREGIKSAGDTGFFCYRAIETLASYFKENASDDMTKKVWLEFRGKVDVSRDEIDAVKSHADVTRHGFVKQIPTDERAKVFAATCNIIDKFIEFGRQGYDGRVSPIEKI